MKTEIRNKIEEALQAIARLRSDYPLDTSAFTRPDELEVYETEVLNEGAIYQERKQIIVGFITRLNDNPISAVKLLVRATALDLVGAFKKIKPRKKLTLAQAAALNHMEQQLQEFLINGLYDELQECFQ